MLVVCIWFELCIVVCFVFGLAFDWLGFVVCWYCVCLLLRVRADCVYCGLMVAD